jgi:hypothetical protein
MSKVLVEFDKKKYAGDPGKLFADKVKYDKIFAKLKELVYHQKSFEEESMMYHYDGSDKQDIWDCMEFFYSNLWNTNFRDYVYTDPTEEFENYNIQLEYMGKQSEVTVVYGIGSFCAISPMNHPPTNASTVLDLDKIVVKTSCEIIIQD